MRFAAPRAAVVAIAALALPAPAGAAVREIGAAGETYRPAAVQIMPGDTVTIGTSSLHPLQYEDEPAGGHASGTYARAFPAAGEFRFYCLNHGGPSGAGMAGRVLVSATNAPPVAALDAPASVAAGAPLSLSAAASHDPEGLPLRFDWDLDGDGLFERDDAGPSQTLAFPYAADRTVRVRVADDPGAVAVAERAIAVMPAAPVQGIGTWREPAPGAAPPAPVGPAAPAAPAATDVRGPRVTARAPRRISFNALRRQGVRVRVVSSESGRVDARLRLGARELARRAVRLRAGRPAVLALRPRRGRVPLPGAGLVVRIAVRDAAGNTTRVTRVVRVVR